MELSQTVIVHLCLKFLQFLTVFGQSFWVKMNFLLIKESSIRWHIPLRRDIIKLILGAKLLYEPKLVTMQHATHSGPEGCVQVILESLDRVRTS